MMGQRGRKGGGDGTLGGGHVESAPTLGGGGKWGHMPRGGGVSESAAAAPAAKLPAQTHLSQDIGMCSCCCCCCCARLCQMTEHCGTAASKLPLCAGRLALAYLKNSCSIVKGPGAPRLIDTTIRY
jgi:hypothetical protein